MAYWTPPRTVQRDLRNELRRLIRDVRHLVDTGLMWESTEIECSIDASGNMTIEVYSTDYLKYLWEEYKLYTFPKKETLERAYMGWVQKKINEQPMGNWKNYKGKVYFVLKD